MKKTLKEFENRELILTSSYPKLKHFSVDNVVRGLSTTLDQAQERQDNLNKEIDELSDQLAKAQAVPEWISVEDGLPSDGQNIIAFDAIKHCVFKDGEFLQGYFEPDTGYEYTEPVDVTHWIAIEPQEPAND